MIKYYNRKSKNYEFEKIAGYKYLNWTYSSPIGMKFLELFVKKKLFSKLYGEYCDSKDSTKKIKPFVDEFNLNMEESKKSIDEFLSFNDFFTRKLNVNARPINPELNTLISPGDGKIIAFENIDLKNVIQIKGYTYSLLDLLNDPLTASKFEGGVCMILRLCPTDYHRFHFLDNGVCGKSIQIKGDYYSVSPIALKKVPELFCKNKREWCIFKSDNFGDVLYVEVGATCVGSIIQTFTPYKEVKKGDEKGYFKFGGSTIVLFFEKNKVQIDSDILEQSKNGIESQVLMGETIGVKILDPKES